MSSSIDDPAVTVVVEVTTTVGSVGAAVVLVERVEAEERDGGDGAGGGGGFCSEGALCSLSRAPLEVPPLLFVPCSELELKSTTGDSWAARVNSKEVIAGPDVEMGGGRSGLAANCADIPASVVDNAEVRTLAFAVLATALGSVARKAFTRRSFFGQNSHAPRSVAVKKKAAQCSATSWGRDTANSWGKEGSRKSLVNFIFSRIVWR